MVTRRKLSSSSSSSHSSLLFILISLSLISSSHSSSSICKKLSLFSPSSSSASSSSSFSSSSTFYFPVDCYPVLLENGTPSPFSSQSSIRIVLNDTSFSQKALETGLASIGLLNDDCRIPLTKVLCGTQFPYCKKSSSSSSSNFEVFPMCSDLCEKAVTKCDKTIDIAPVVNCSNFLLSDAATCVAYNESSEFLPSSCPEPFIRDGSKDPICAIPCENPFISPPTIVALDQLKVWLALVSLFVDLLVIVGVLTSKERRAFPGNMIGFLTIPQILISGTFILGYMIGYKQIRCKSKTEPSTQFDYGFCGFEGAMIYLGSSVLACYWLVLSFNLFLSTVFKVSFEKGRFSIWTILSYHLFAWGLPLVGLISLLSLEKFGYERQDWWCFVLDDYDLYFFWTWLGAFLVLVAVFLLMSGIAMYRIRTSVGRGSLRQSLHLLFFGGAYFVLFGYYFGLWVKQQSLNLEIGEYATDYANCLLEQYEQPRSDLEACNLTSPFKPEELVIAVILLASSGLFIFVAFELRPSFIPHWKKLLTNLSKADFKAIATMD